MALPPPKQEPWGLQRNGRSSSLILRPDWPRYLHMPSPFDLSDVGAWQALNECRAAPHQQARLLEHLALITWFNADIHVPGDPHGTEYLAGKRSILSQIDMMIKYVPDRRADGGEQG